MWRWFFGPKATIYGIDVSNRTKVYEKHPSYGSPDHIYVGARVILCLAKMGWGERGVCGQGCRVL